MRQAGRHLPEYRDVRGKGSILDVLRDPDRVTEITLQPVHRYGVDAAILYSDIVVTAHAVGFGIDVVEGVGPMAESPLRTPADLDRLRPLEPEVDTPWVTAAVKQCVSELDIPLIGFAGAPFTVASYLIEGRPSRDHLQTKQLMHTDPQLFAAIADRLADHAITHLHAQVSAGVSAVQLFDSWVGALSPSDFQRFVFEPTTKIITAAKSMGVPVIYFGVGTSELLSLMAKTGADVLGVDWRVPLDSAWSRIGYDRAIQGNLDPALCLSPWPEVKQGIDDILAAAGDRAGHIFNLGHGVLPPTDPATMQQVVDYVHAQTARQ